MIARTIEILIPCSLFTHEPQCVSRSLPVLGFSMTKGLIIAVVFLGVIVLLNRGGSIKEKLMDIVDYLNERKHGLRKHGPAAISKLRKPRVVTKLTEGQIPQVKKQIEEISTLINRHVETIRQQRDAAVTLARSSGLTSGHAQYEKEYARQVNMINAAIPKLITEADRISAVDAAYKQHIHDWILAVRKSLEDYDPGKFEQMANAGSSHGQQPTIGKPHAP